MQYYIFLYNPAPLFCIYLWSSENYRSAGTMRHEIEPKGRMWFGFPGQSPRFGGSGLYSVIQSFP